MQIVFALDALGQAPNVRQPKQDEGLVHHSDRGSQYVSICYSERLAETEVNHIVAVRTLADMNLDYRIFSLRRS